MVLRSSLSRITFGAWRICDRRGSEQTRLSTSDVARLIKQSVDLGITSFDHADIYGDYRCESVFGDALTELGIKRHQLQFVSKCGIKLVSSERPEHRSKSYDTSRAHIVGSVEKSLRNLRTDYLDLLLIHRPDPLMDPAEVAEAFDALRSSGKVRFFGVSNFAPWQTDALQSFVKTPLITNQVELSPLAWQTLTDGTFDHCLRARMTPMIWSPLAGGRLLTGQGEHEKHVRDTLARIGREHGDFSADQVALAWALRHPTNPIVVVGTTTAERLAIAARSTEITLTRQQWHEVWSAGMGREVP